VEDDPLLLFSFAEILRDLGHDVRETVDPAEALAWIDAHEHVDVLFTDIHMPLMDGRELARRARRVSPALHIVFATGYSAQKVRDLEDDPRARYLRKPFGPEQMADAMEWARSCPETAT
jgi:CheY-like chemotaxis protein